MTRFVGMLRSIPFIVTKPFHFSFSLFETKLTLELKITEKSVEMRFAAKDCELLFQAHFYNLQAISKFKGYLKYFGLLKSKSEGTII